MRFSLVRPNNKFPLREQPVVRRHAFRENDAFRENKTPGGGKGVYYTADSQRWSQLGLERSRRLDFSVTEKFVTG